jgi:hypothetical protein
LVENSFKKYSISNILDRLEDDFIQYNDGHMSSADSNSDESSGE